MAKPGDLNSIFRKTEPGTDTPPAGIPEAEPMPTRSTDRTVSIGVGLKESERDTLDSIAATHGIARNALIRFAVRRLLADYDAGAVDLADYIEQPERSKRLRMP